MKRNELQILGLFDEMSTIYLDLYKQLGSVMDYEELITGGSILSKTQHQ